MMSEAATLEAPSNGLRVLAEGVGWRVSDIQCGAGPGDTPFEERHDWVSIAAVLGGVFTYRSGHGRNLMTPGSLLLGNFESGFCCSHEHGRGDRCVAFHFDPAAFEELASGLSGIRAITFRRHRIPPLEAFAPAFADIWALTGSADNFAAEETAFRLAARVLQVSEEGDERRASLADEARIARALAHIDACLTEPVTLHGLAAAAGLSRYHFLRVFRKVVGVTPYRYVLNRRLTRAAQRLRTGNETVTAVAYECGFSDLSEFTRRFRHRFGMPPAAYRRSGTSRRGAARTGL